MKNETLSFGNGHNNIGCQSLITRETIPVSRYERGTPNGSENTLAQSAYLFRGHPVFNSNTRHHAIPLRQLKNRRETFIESIESVWNSAAIASGERADLSFTEISKIFLESS